MPEEQTHKFYDATKHHIQFASSEQIAPNSPLVLMGIAHVLSPYRPCEIGH